VTKSFQVTNGLEAAYNFSRGSPVIELTDARVGELADGILTVTVRCTWQCGGVWFVAGVCSSDLRVSWWQTPQQGGRVDWYRCNSLEAID
jgi:hypothetical protein